MNWLKLNKLTLNMQKTKYITFRKSLKNVTLLNLSIDDMPIDSVDEFNYLRTILHVHLTYINYINIDTVKIAKVSSIVNKLQYISLNALFYACIIH